MADEVKPSYEFANARELLQSFSPLGSIGTSAGGNPIWGKRLGWRQW
jgi:hypothetical protein